MKKKQIVVQWNHLQYLDQVRAMDKINELIESQTDETMKIALTAALLELEVWSNAPVEVVNALVDDESAEDEEETSKKWIH